MKTVSFQNKGVLDPILIKTFGVNVKDNDNAIGYFGTGLKYAIAVLLREGHTIEIVSGDNHCIFGVDSRNIRGKDFSFVTMNGEPLGFTTELGKNWDVWQAFRELYCNATDESGYVEVGELKHEKDMTTVYVSGEAFHKAYLERDRIVLSSSPIVADDTAEIHHGNSSYVFYRGVRIYDGFNTSLYTYNMLRTIDITEDRTASYEFQMRDGAARTIIGCSDKKIIKDCILAEKNTFENDLDYAQYSNYASEAFLSVAKKYRRNKDLNLTVTGVLSKHGMEEKPKQADLNAVQKKQLEKAIWFCSEIGYPVDNYSITVTHELKGGVMGLAENEGIYIATDTFGMGTKYLASTLIEEYLHLSTGYGDMTRSLQNYLFNDIVSMGEQLIGKPI